MKPWDPRERASCGPHPGFSSNPPFVLGPACWGRDSGTHALLGQRLLLGTANWGKETGRREGLYPSLVPWQ